MRLVCLLSTLLFLSHTHAAGAETKLHINRKEKTLVVVGADNKVLFQSPVGIGKGGLKRKRSMNDLVTPTGDFVVDLVLVKSTPKFNNVSPKYLRRYSKKVVGTYLSSPDALGRLFKNMNSIDFDGNGKPDGAYGSAYFGFSSQKAVTGPKLSTFKGTRYWYSIAMHGTPHEQRDIGDAYSGGCVHLPAATIEKLVANKWISVGTKVTISDSSK
jgi:hypothetical protein